MPQIPVDFQVGRTPFAGGDIRAEANPAAFGAKGAALAQGGEQVSAEAQQFANQYGEALRQKQAANLSFKGMSQLSSAQEKWSRVPDAQAAIAGFRQDSQTIRDKITGQSSDPEVQALVLRQLNQHAIFAENSVQNRSFGLEASQHRANLDAQLDGYAQMAAATPDPVTRASIVDSATSAVKGSVAAGWMYAEQGEDRLFKFRNQVWGNAVEQGLRTNPARTLAALDAGEYENRLAPEMRERLQPAIDRAQAGIEADRYPFAHLSGGGAGAAGTHNPGNIKLATGGFASYGSDEEGVAAIGRNLDAYADQHGINTLAGVISRWAPPSENQTGQLIQNAAERTGFAPNEPIDLHDPVVKQQVIGAIIQQEQGRPGDQAMIERVANGHSTATGSPLGATTGTPFTAAAGAVAPEIDQTRAAISQRVESGAISERVGELAMGEVNRRYTIWRSATDGQRHALGQQLDDGQAMLAAGKTWDPPTADIRRLLPADQADDVLRRIDEAREAGQLKNAVQFADPQQLAGIASSARARLDSGVDFARNQRYFNQIGAAISDRNKALSNDPAAYVRQSPVVGAAWDKIDPDNPGPGTQAAVTASLGEQARLGVRDEDQRVLTTDGAGRLAQAIADQDPANIDMPAQIDKLASTYGRYWQKAFGETIKAGLPADYQVLATMDRPEQVVAAGDYQRMLQEIGAKGGAQKLRDAIAPEAVKNIGQDLPDIMSSFRGTVPDPGQYQMMAGAVQNLARYYAYRGDDPGTALQKAYNGLVGAHWEFDDALRVPKGELAPVKRAAQAVQDGIKLDQLGPVPGNPQLTPEQRQGIYRDAIKNGFWATNESDDGAVLMLKYRNGGLAPARTSDGRRVEFKFADAARLVQQAGPPALPAPEPGAVP